MDADLALRWISETGGGSIRSLRERASWLARGYGAPPPRPAVGRWLRDLSTLAHVDLDWEAGRWLAAPAVLTRLPGSDAFAVLAGSRTATLETALRHAAFEVTPVPQSEPGTDLPRPSALLLQYDSAEELRVGAGELGVAYVPCAALALSRRLPPLEAGAAAAPPPGQGAELEQLDLGTLSFRPAGQPRDPAPGLYRHGVLGRKQHLLRGVGTWAHCDRPQGVFLELHRNGQNVIRWRPETARGRECYGRLFVDLGAPLPAAHRRALSLCSGLLPKFSSRARMAAYDNVPRQVAGAVASALRQQLGPA